MAGWSAVERALWWKIRHHILLWLPNFGSSVTAFAFVPTFH
jgi:hypothetical protein